MFEVGVSYSREEIQNRIGGGNPRTGIVWAKGTQDPVVLIHDPTGSERYGYSDGCKVDGLWRYTGQGTSGDQDETRAANRLLIAEWNIKHLFVKDKGGYNYLGQYRTTEWKWERPTSGVRSGDRLIQATLARIEG